MIGTTPVLTWRHFRDPNDVTVNAASFRGLDWQTEIAALASAQGADVKPVTLPSGRMSLAWTRLGGAGNFELVAARRRLDGSWSTPAVIRSGGAGMVVLRSAQASDGAGGLMAIWSEAPGIGTAPPETLLSSQFDETLDAWGAALTVDAGQHYGEAAISSPADGQWVAAWLSGGALGNTALLSKRFAAGAWSPATTRVDLGQDAVLAEMVLTSRNHHVHLGWIGVPNGAATGSVRGAAFDATAGAWSAPSLIGATPRGFPVGLRHARRARRHRSGGLERLAGRRRAVPEQDRRRRCMAGNRDAARSRRRGRRPRRRAVLVERHRDHLVPDRGGWPGRRRRAQAPLTRRDDSKPSFRTPSPAGPGHAGARPRIGV